MQRMSGIATLTRKFVDAVSRHQGAHSRYSQDGSRPARHRQIRGALRRRTESPARSFRWRSDQEQSHCAGGRNRSGAGARASQPARLAATSKSKCAPWRNWSRRWLTVPKPFCWTTCLREDVRRAVERCAQAGTAHSVECSGGIRLENVRAYAETGVDFISVGLLTHSAPGRRYEPAGELRRRSDGQPRRKSLSRRARHLLISFRLLPHNLGIKQTAKFRRTSRDQSARASTNCNRLIFD